MSLRYLAFGLLGLFVASCATLNQVKMGSPKRQESSRDWMGEANKRVVRSGTVFFEAKREGSSPVRAPGVLVVQWPDSIRLELEDPLGGVQALFISQGGRFWWYRADAPSILTGAAHSLPETLGLATTPAELVGAFLARPSDLSADGRWNRSSEGDWSNGKELLEEEGGEIRSWSRPNLWRVFFFDWQAQGGLRWPKRIAISDLKHGQREWQIEWRDWESQLPASQNPFQFPKETAFGRPIKVLP